MEPTLEAVVPNQGMGTGPTTAGATALDTTSVLFSTITFGLENIALGGGGSAMPCGFVLPAFSAQLELAELLPIVSPVASLY